MLHEDLFNFRCLSRVIPYEIIKILFYPPPLKWLILYQMWYLWVEFLKIEFATEFLFSPDLGQYANFDKEFFHVFRASVNFEPAF